MWNADKIVYRGEDDFIRAYQGSELVWEKSIPNNVIYYTSSDGQIVTPDIGAGKEGYGFGANIVSNTYSEGRGVIVFDGPVTKIGYEAFSRTDITTIDIPKSTTAIYDSFFLTNLTSIYIPASVTDNCLQGSFARSENLTSIVVDPNNPVYDSRDNCNAVIKTSVNTLVSGCNATVIPSTIERIDYRAFFGFLGITSITLPSSVKSISSQAFYECNNLSSIDLGSVERLNPNCLGRTALSTLNIPSTVISLGGLVCSDCYNLSSITVNSNNQVYDNRNNCNAVIETATNTLIMGCNSTVIPSTVTKLADYCFYGKGITSVTIPTSVIEIGRHSFESCTYLTEVIMESTVPPILGYNVFTNTSSNLVIKVPAESLQAYKTATGWSDYADDIIAQ